MRCGTRDDTSLIDSFVVGSDGLLHAAADPPYPAQGLGPIGAQFRPTNLRQLYVSNAHAGTGLVSVSSFTVNARVRCAPTTRRRSPTVSRRRAGSRSARTASASTPPTPAPGTCRRTGSRGTGTLTLVGTTAFTNGTGAVDLRLSPDGSTLSVTGGRGHVLTTFAVDGAKVTELPGSPVALPADGSPTGISVLRPEPHRRLSPPLRPA